MGGSDPIFLDILVKLLKIMRQWKIQSTGFLPFPRNQTRRLYFRKSVTQISLVPHMLFLLFRSLERHRDMIKDVYARFIDFTKAFISVNHEKFIYILQKAGLDSIGIWISSNLY